MLLKATIYVGNRETSELRNHENPLMPSVPITGKPIAVPVGLEVAYVTTECFMPIAFNAMSFLPGSKGVFGGNAALLLMNAQALQHNLLQILDQNLDLAGWC